MTFHDIPWYSMTFGIFKNSPPTTFPSPSAIRISSSMKKRRLRSSWTIAGGILTLQDCMIAFWSAMEIWNALVTYPHLTPSMVPNHRWCQTMIPNLCLPMGSTAASHPKSSDTLGTAESAHRRRRQRRRWCRCAACKGAVLHRTTPQQRSRHELSRQKLSMNETREQFAYSAVPGHKK